VEGFNKLQAAFSEVPLPREVHGDGMGIDASTDRIERLLQADPERASVDDFLGYVGYAGFTTGGVDDFRFLLPTMLRLWGREVLDCSRGWFVEHFHQNLADLDFFQQHLSVSQREAACNFMRRTLLQRFEKERLLCSHYSPVVNDWFGCLATFGALTDEVARLWSEWWSMPTPGHARAALQYASILSCDDDDNPVFSPRMVGGTGVPRLWWYEASCSWKLFWKPANIAFLRETLTPNYLDAAMVAARERLGSDERGIADQLLEELRTSSQPRVIARCEALCRALESPNKSVLADWYAFGGW
jgi:hypothetical protein